METLPIASFRRCEACDIDRGEGMRILAFDHGWPRWVELTRSPHRRRTTGTCALRPFRVAASNDPNPPFATICRRHDRCLLRAGSHRSTGTTNGSDAPECGRRRYGEVAPKHRSGRSSNGVEPGGFTLEPTSDARRAVDPLFGSYRRLASRRSNSCIGTRGLRKRCRTRRRRPARKARRGRSPLCR